MLGNALHRPVVVALNRSLIAFNDFIEGLIGRILNNSKLPYVNDIVRIVGLLNAVEQIRFPEDLPPITTFNPFDAYSPGASSSIPLF